MNEFKLVAPYTPQGDQPQAIQELVEGLNKELKNRHFLVQPVLGRRLRLLM